MHAFHVLCLLMPPALVCIGLPISHMQRLSIRCCMFFFFSIEGLLIMLPEFGMQGQAAWSHTGKCFTPQPGKVILVAKNLNNIKII